MTSSTRLPSVAVLGLGGTIASSAPTRDSYLEYGAPGFHISLLVRHLQDELDGIARTYPEQVLATGSSSLTIENLATITLAVERALDEHDAVVVTSGSDALEEISYWLDLTVQSDKPVIVTGSMRPFAIETANAGDVSPVHELVHGADGPANLLAAVTLAASGHTTGSGTVVVFGDVIHAARDVVKRNSTRVDAFESPMPGPLGYLDGGMIVLHRLPSRKIGAGSARALFDLRHRDLSNSFPRVEILVSYPGGGGEAVSAYETAGVGGIVLDGMGFGAVTTPIHEACTAAAERGMWFVTTTRTGTGSVHNVDHWSIAGGDLVATKARLLTILLLDSGIDLSSAHSAFREVAMPMVNVSRKPGSRKLW
ncbi:asparaginase [Rhodococcus erythropolis]|uniref:asparaginase n=1 Tax=Rhodococcus erythropolis TaxID=1833 RepID=UPI0008782EA2|nr:asparaginase [Rhodococcus erythropolis]OFV75277.1 L-asparaginase 2 precursor [Rhodococcus erythropolis]